MILCPGRVWSPDVGGQRHGESAQFSLRVIDQYFRILPHLGEGLRRSLAALVCRDGLDAQGTGGIPELAGEPAHPCCRLARFGCQDRDRAAYLPGPQVSGDFDRGNSVGYG
jgi:hypothetical protein